jgi:hypothetical protein
MRISAPSSSSVTSRIRWRVKEVWAAKQDNRMPRNRQELAKFIDDFVLEEALSSP